MAATPTSNPPPKHPSPNIAYPLKIGRTIRKPLQLPKTTFLTLKYAFKPDKTNQKLPGTISLTRTSAQVKFHCGNNQGLLFNGRRSIDNGDGGVSKSMPKEFLVIYRKGCWVLERCEDVVLGLRTDPGERVEMGGRVGEGVGGGGVLDVFEEGLDGGVGRDGGGVGVGGMVGGKSAGKGVVAMKRAGGRRVVRGRKKESESESASEDGSEDGSEEDSESGSDDSDDSGSFTSSSSLE